MSCRAARTLPVHAPFLSEQASGLSVLDIRAVSMQLISFLALVLPIALALDIKWTPAKDAGSARFSKRHRDAAGIDDSKWTGEKENDTWMPSVLPDTLGGWVMAASGVALCYYLYRQQQQPGHYARETRADGRQQPSEASEAARAAFLKRFEPPGQVAAPLSRKCD
jgi:predicted aminopeptidase